MTRTDINDYANNLLLDFLDAFHRELKLALVETYGDEWLDRGIERHLSKEYFQRVRQMLESPMRVIDMGKSDDELYGVEHLANIVIGNWKPCDFKSRFGDPDRTKVYLGEVAELRHNVSHRRRHQMLRRRDLVRVMGHCELLLRSIGSSEHERFSEIVTSLSGGSSPWGEALGGYLPPSDEVVREFLGRPVELSNLSEWLAGDSPQLLVWGYGGAGKSSLAYEFAREAKQSAPTSISLICWVSAKASEFVEGTARDRLPEFTSRKELVRSIWNAIYEADIAGEAGDENDLLIHLSEEPILLVIDDFDTVLADESLVEFAMHELRSTRSRVLYTSRQKVAGIPALEVRGFSGAELEEFVRVKARVHGLDEAECVKRTEAIHSVTGGFPLFVDDLLRYAKLTGLKDALSDWHHRRGDAAREYALRRQLDSLGDAAQEVLIAVTVAKRPLTKVELATIAGLTDDDAEFEIQSLLDWGLIIRVSGEDDRPGFSANPNTQRLVERTYGGNPAFAASRAKFKAIGPDNVSTARRAAIGGAIARAKTLIVRGDVEAAIETLRGSMTGELSESPELFGALGWAYSRNPNEYYDKAVQAFQRAYELGATRVDTFYHWAELEKATTDNEVGQVADNELLEGWQRAAKAAETGMRVCGKRRQLAFIAGYCFTRQGKTLNRLNEFTQAQGAFAQGASILRDGLKEPREGPTDPTDETMYRWLVRAFEGLGQESELEEALEEWRRAGGSDATIAGELDRLARSFPNLRVASLP